MRATRLAALAAGPLAALALAGCSPEAGAGVADFAIDYPDYPAPAGAPPPPCAAATHAGSTHEITFDERRGGALWISGQNDDALVKVAPDGANRPRMQFHRMPPCSGPHGIAFDADGRLWVTLEFLGRIRLLDAEGRFVRDFDVTAGGVSPHPHGLGVGADGRTIWWTGKAAGIVGRITPDGELRSFALPTPNSLPIYIRSGPDGNMWVTELTGNNIARVTPEGAVTEFPIPTPNSRPIAIVPGPDGAMWFSEEAGSKVGRITRDGTITEYPVPRDQPNRILAGLAFDRAGNLWVQQYVDHNHPEPGGTDALIRIDRAALAGPPPALRPAHFTTFPVPTRDTVMHRIIEGPDGAMWFTEMHADKLGRIAAGPR